MARLPFDLAATPRPARKYLKDLVFSIKEMPDAEDAKEEDAELIEAFSFRFTYPSASAIEVECV